MDDFSPNLRVIYLQPGEFHVARDPAIIKTILGSCVGVTFWSKRLSIGALFHGVLPRCPEGAPRHEKHRYVDFAIRDLATRFEGFGAFRAEVQVKVFGGADVLPVQAGLTRRATVGRQNRDSALEVLERESLSVVASDVGGRTGRAIQFHTGTGEVLVRRLLRLPEEEFDLPDAGGN